MWSSTLSIPFYTTKDVGEGSGLGLSMVYGFVKQSGGHTEIRSKPGKGTTIRMYFPRAASEPEQASVNPTVQAPRGRGETIVVVEDNLEVRALAVMLLEGLNYKVIEAASARAGLAMIEAAPRVDLLLTDIVLPGGQSGPELSMAVRRRWPDVKVLYMTGYARNALEKRIGLHDDIELLQKPFRKSTLASKVRRVLDGPASGAGSLAVVQPSGAAL